MSDRYSAIVTYADRTRDHHIGTWAEVCEWLASRAPGTVSSVSIGHVIAEGVMPR
jgi:hypothetical protein